MIRRYEGPGRIKKLGEVIEELGSKKPLIITGKRSFDNSGARKILKPILDKYSTTYFTNFTENPNITEVEEGINVLKENQCDLIVAIGGGTAMDLSKLISLFRDQDDKAESYIINGTRINKKGVPIVTIPTTAGSGSEATHFAVVYINKKKYSVASPYMLPTVSILDFELTKSLPSHITASSGLDAFSQAIESFWSINSTEESSEYSKCAISIILGNIESTVIKPDSKSRQGMLEAANLAGRAINITKTTAAHALSYPLTSYYGISHGHAVALFLVFFLEYNGEISGAVVSDPRGTDFVFENHRILMETLSCKNGKEASNMLSQLIGRLGLQSTFSELELANEKSISLILGNVNRQRLKNNPLQVDFEKVRKFILTN